MSKFTIAFLGCFSKTILDFFFYIKFLSQSSRFIQKANVSQLFILKIWPNLKDSFVKKIERQKIYLNFQHG